jgi:hypothetical protein
MLFNLPQPVKTNPERERVRIRRTKILRKQREPKLHLLMIGISANPNTLVLSVVMITTLRIVHDTPRLLSSFKGPRNHPLRSILSQPFPSQQQAQLVIHDQPSPSTTSYVLMCTGDSKKNDIALTTRAKDYSPSKEKVDDIPPSLVQPSPTTPPTNGPLHLE